MMFGYFRGIDWRTLLLGLVGCYVLPWLILGTAILAFTGPHQAAIAGWVPLTALFLDFIGPPMLGGYFAARFAKNRPQFHVLLLVLLGTSAYFVLGRSWTLIGFATVAVTYIACTSVGAFLFLRRGRRIGAGE